MPETYRGEVYDAGREGVNFRLEPNGRKCEFKTDFDFRLGANDDPAKLADVAKEILEEGGEVVFPTTKGIRDSFSGNDGISGSQVNRMRGFTAEEQRKVLGEQ